MGCLACFSFSARFVACPAGDGTTGFPFEEQNELSTEWLRSYIGQSSEELMAEQAPPAFNFQIVAQSAEGIQNFDNALPQ
jgi:hypothetical protein